MRYFNELDGHLHELFLSIIEQSKSPISKNLETITVVSIGCGENFAHEARELARCFTNRTIDYHGFDIKPLQFEHSMPLIVNPRPPIFQSRLIIDYHQCDTQNLGQVQQCLNGKKADIILLRHPLFGKQPIPNGPTFYIPMFPCSIAKTCHNVIPEIASDHTMIIATTFHENERNDVESNLAAYGMVNLKRTNTNGPFQHFTIAPNKCYRDGFILVYPDYQPQTVKVNRKPWQYCKLATTFVVGAVGIYAANWFIGY